MVTLAWVAGGIVVLVGLIALSDLLGARRASKALLRKPPHDPREHARIQARDSRVPDHPRGDPPGLL
jgi:hypothetical protein